MSASKVVRSYRLTPALVEAVEAEAERRQVERSVVVRETLERAFGLAAPSPDTGGEVDLVGWLVGRTGRPRALVTRAMRRGAVTVNGEVVSPGRRVAASDLAGARWDDEEL